MGNNLPMTAWGWKKQRDTMLAIGITEPPAPEILLKKLFCSYRRGCTNACGCRKLGKVIMGLLK